MNSNGKGTKRLLEDAELGREKRIDNTASIKEIAKQLSQRETYSKPYKFYNQLLVPRHNMNIETFHYTMPGHPIQNFTENWDGGVSSDFFEPFLYRSTMPKVVSEIRNLNKSDPVTDDIRIKLDWKYENNVIKRFTIGESKLEYLNDEVAQCPKYLIDLAARLERDPNPNFDAFYNWYYAGNGNMQLVCVDQIDYLLHSDLSSVYLSRFYKDDVTVECDPAASFNCEHDNNILETICSQQNIVVLRTKNKIFILKIVDTEVKLLFEKLKLIESDSPFTSISFDKYHTNILYLTTLENKLTIMNLDRMAGKIVKLKHNRTSLLNNWNRVVGIERSSFMHVEKNAISLYDKRTNSLATSWTGLKDIVDMVICNDITMAKVCEGSPSLYFTTDHHVFLMDTRASKKKNLKVVKRWTHGLQSAPTYISIGKSDNNKEFVVLSSQWCQDMCVINNYADSVVNSCGFSGLSMPYHPPNIMDALHEARLKMLCFDIHNPIDKRITTSTTGMLVLEQNENCCMLTQNALGDIFLRTLYPQYMESIITDNSVQRLHEWSQSLKTERKDFEVSSIKNIADVWLKLKKVPDLYDFGPRNTNDYYNESKIYEAFQNEELIPELLEVWTNDQDNETKVEQSTLSLNVHYDSND